MKQHRSLARSMLATTAVFVLLGVMMPVPASAFWSASTSPGSVGAASAATVLPGSTPTGSVATQNDVTVSWAATTLSTGLAVSGYTVTRFNSIVGAQNALAGCAGLVTSTSCLESNVPDGLWTYRVTPRFATNWVGATSTASLEVRSDATLPLSSISLTNKTGGGSFLTGTTLFFRGALAGSFQLANALTDTGGSGPASSSTGSLGGAAGWAHTPSTVSTPIGGPFVSNLFSWTAGATTIPAVLINALDNAGNSAAPLTIQFALDNDAPTGGAISYAGGATTANSVAVTVQAIADAGAGVSAGTRHLQWRTAGQSGNSGNCRDFGALFENQVGNPAVAPATQTVSVVPGLCYQFQYVFTDNVGNQTVNVSPNVVIAR